MRPREEKLESLRGRRLVGYEGADIAQHRAASRRNQQGITISNDGLLQIGSSRFKRRFERGVHRAQRKNLEVPIQDDTELVMAPDSSGREILANRPREQTESVDDRLDETNKRPVYCSRSLSWLLLWTPESLREGVTVLLLPPYLLNGVKLEMRTGHATSNGLRYRMHETQGGGRWRVQSLLVGGVAQRACNLDTGRRAPSESEVSLFLLPLFWRARAARLFFTTPRRAGWEEVGPPARLAPDRALVSSAFNGYCGGRWYHWCAEVGGRGQCGACTVGKR
ncbi:hypothetical protein DFH06DRAFT_1140878 [Mycena polygramma]|nr:hypothetical protein DFH06DRAFT_1140878 [Mycena polygramma]